MRAGGPREAAEPAWLLALVVDRRRGLPRPDNARGLERRRRAERGLHRPHPRRVLPNTGQPSDLPDDNYRAGAVQAAIWFFSDRYVLSTDDPLHAAVGAIVTAVIKAGPIKEPPPPSLTISPSSKTGLVSQAVGPFTVSSSVAAAVSASGASMFKDAAGTQPINDGDTVPDGTPIWLKSTSAGTARLTATAHTTVPSGNVYLYSGNVPGVYAGQKLILAKTAVRRVRLARSREDDQGAGRRQAGANHDQRELRQGRAATGLHDRRPNTGDDPLQDVRGHSGRCKCTVTETGDGHTDRVLVDVSGSGESHTVPANGTVTARITNTYTLPAPGSLIVHKTITGSAAGKQGEIRIRVVCDETPDTQTPDFVIPAGMKGPISRLYENIPAGAICTVSELFDGSTSSVSVQVTGSGRQVTVPSGSRRRPSSRTSTRPFRARSSSRSRSAAAPQGVRARSRSPSTAARTPARWPTSSSLPARKPERNRRRTAPSLPAPSAP